MVCDIRMDSMSMHEDRLTHMVCNIPCRVSEDRLIEALNETGFVGCFDVVYIPKVRSKSGKVHNFGYGFINFTCAFKSACFREMFNGYRFLDFASDKVCEVRDSHVQGKELSLLRMGRKRITKKKAVIPSPHAAEDLFSEMLPPEPRHVPACKFADLPFGMAFQ
eukprot:TRINITY_DN32134_c0_g1_i1.p1 TRINITY_DN32134_c0_g1~~TRINITY_DN32134_c0_g1_i1.p1  ORF type:complete len:164 (-),score=23.03 TRINITY_DN32134_c0_g1_i1:113-604(-)